MKPRKGKKDYSELAYHCLVRATDGSKKLSTVVEVRRRVPRASATDTRPSVCQLQDSSVSDLSSLHLQGKEFARFHESYSTIVRVRRPNASHHRLCGLPGCSNWK